MNFECTISVLNLKISILRLNVGRFDRWSHLMSKFQSPIEKKLHPDLQCLDSLYIFLSLHQ